MATVRTDEERSTSKVGHMQAMKAYNGELRYSSIGTDGDGYFELFMYQIKMVTGKAISLQG
jgi:hypothetical protein